MTVGAAATLRRKPAALPASAGWQWIREAFALVGAKPGFWIGSFLPAVGLMAGVSLIPIFGQIIAVFVGPFLVAGFSHAARQQAMGLGPGLNDLLIGFRVQTGKLIAIAVLYLAGILAIIVVAFAILFAALGAAFIAHDGALDAEMLVQTGPWIAIAWSFVLALTLPLLMAYWFAPLLVVFDDLDAIDAMKTSFVVPDDPRVLLHEPARDLRRTLTAVLRSAFARTSAPAVPCSRHAAASSFYPCAPSRPDYWRSATCRPCDRRNAARGRL